MKDLSDKAIRRLQQIADEPDLSGTRYRLIEESGRGGMGVVYLAEDHTLGRRVALKVLQVEDPKLTVRLEREARILARLEHPNIVPIYDAGLLPDGRLYYAMKFVEGVRLDEFRAQAQSLPDVLRLFEKLCEGTAFAHSRGVLHRDLKPENVMVGPFGEVLIMDWGVARVLSDPEEIAGVVVGTAAYMAPEQAKGDDSQIDERADIYSLGTMLRFLLEAFPSPPRPLASIVRKATAPAREHRYSSATELAADVARFLDSGPVLAHRESIWEKGVRFGSRNREWLLLIAVYLIVRSAILYIARR
jgi:eukaryotic-like serine/threonine-protein kinase